MQKYGNKQQCKHLSVDEKRYQRTICNKEVWKTNLKTRIPLNKNSRLTHAF